MKLDFQEMFNAYVANHQKVWGHDRAKTVGASETFACIRKTGFGKRGAEFGYEQDADYENRWGAMERGNLIEDHWVVPVLDEELPEGVGLLWAGDDQATFVQEPVSATPDGLMTELTKDAFENYGIDDIKSDCALVEIKSIDPRVTLKEAKDQHFGQVIMQIGLIREETEWKPEYGILIYVDASFLDAMKYFIVKFDEQTYKTGKIRSAKVFDVDKLEDLEAEGKLSDDCKYCPWVMSCYEVSKEAMPENTDYSNLPVDTLDQLLLLVEKERVQDALEKEAKEEKELLRANIKQVLAESEVRMAGDERFKVSWVMQKGRSTFDKAAAIVDGVDIEKYQKVGPGFEKMSIKLIDEPGT